MGGYWQDRRKVMKLALTAIEKMVEAGGAEYSDSLKTRKLSY
jgi:hypothetical protein